MPKCRIHKLFTSIFFKLMAIILVAGVGINIAILVFFIALKHHVSRDYHLHLNRYVDYLLKDIGDPPDPAIAKQIASETDTIIICDGEDQQWSTADEPIAIPMDRIRIRHDIGALQAGRYRGRYVAMVDQAHGRLTFVLSLQPDAEKKFKMISVRLLFVITSLMAAAYLAIRWLLKPLRWLKQGVEHVARGDLSHRVPLKRSDELRDLSASFNTMTERLQQLIHAKEQLLLDVSHELRTPITRIKIALALMPESSNRTSIEEDLKEVDAKIAELLETARSLNIKASLNYAPVHLDELIQKVARMLGAGNPSIDISAIPERPVIQADAERMGKALKNILDNSQKYSPDSSQPIRVSVAVEASEVVISIQDSGIGISHEDLDFVFEPFYRADKARTPKQGGYGLGLSLAKNIIEAHGGRIVIHSKVGEGTLVQVYLPLEAGKSK